MNQLFVGGTEITSSGGSVTLASVTGNYLSLSGQEITAGTVPISLGGTGATTASAARTALGLAIGTNVQAYNSGLENIGNLTNNASGKMLYTLGGGDGWAFLTSTTAGRTLLTNADASAQRSSLGLVIGTNVQAYNAGLAQIAALDDANGNFIVGNGSAWVAESGSTVRTSLGLGSLATLGTINNSYWSGTDLAIINGGTGASSAADARTNLGLGTGNSPQFSTIQLGHATDTTIARSAAGKVTIEGYSILTAHWGAASSNSEYGSLNIVIGNNAGYNMTDSTNLRSNILIGDWAGYGTTDDFHVGKDNIMIGTKAAVPADTYSTLQSWANTAIGYYSGRNSTKNLWGTTCIGYKAKAERSHSIILGAVGAQNNMACRVGIGIANPTVELDVVGSIKASNDLTVGDDLTVTGDIQAAAISATTLECVNINGTIITAAQTNITSVGTLSSLTTSDTSIIGFTRIGKGPGGYGTGSGEYAMFSNKELTTTSNYCLIQSKYGETMLNVASGQTMHFREDNNEKMTLKGGRLGIGSTSPRCRLHVQADSATNNSQRTNYFNDSANESLTSTSSNFTISIYGTNAIFAEDYIVASDERIKENISVVPDDLSLTLLRNIECYYYNYIDNAFKQFDDKNTEKTIGFLAQQVAEHCELAVETIENVIPNEYRTIENPQWQEIDISGNTKYKLTINDLQGDYLTHTTYKFFVRNQESTGIIIDDEGNTILPLQVCKKLKTSIEDDANSFIFDIKWDNVFLFGHEVDDFHVLKKERLWAINFSASQEIDKIQQEEKTKLEAAEAKIASLEAENVTLKARLDAIEARLNAGGL